MDKIRNIAGTARPEIVKRNAGTASAMHNGYAAGNSELKAVRREIDLDMCAPLKVQGLSFDEASGKAEVEDFAAQQQAAVGEIDFGLTFAEVAKVTAAV